MSGYLYDKALVEKFQKWTSKSKTQIYGPNETRRLYETIADSTTDSKIKLPLIAISRDMGYEIINSGTTRRPLSYDGVDRQYNAETNSMKIINAIPISLTYQIDVYARKAEEADILMRNLVFNIVNYPAMEVSIPGADLNHTARISFGSKTISDNSNMSERFIEGNMTVLSAIISIDDAYLWDVRQHRNAEIEIRIDDTYESRRYRCLNCKYVYEGFETPDICPICGEKEWEKVQSSIQDNVNGD